MYICNITAALGYYLWTRRLTRGGVSFYQILRSTKSYDLLKLLDQCNWSHLLQHKPIWNYVSQIVRVDKHWLRLRRCIFGKLRNFWRHRLTGGCGESVILWAISKIRVHKRGPIFSTNHMIKRNCVYNYYNTGVQTLNSPICELDFTYG